MRPGKPLETNPWFGYDVARLGEKAALREALGLGRETMTTPGPDCKCGRPTWYRPMLGKKTCYACQPGEPVDGAPPVPPVPYRIPENVDLDPADIEVTYKHSGVDVVLIPDDVARAMEARIKKSWKEWPGQAYGESIRFFPGHWMHTITMALLAAYGASPVPLTETGADIGRAETARRRARGDDGGLPEAYISIAGRSDWDPQARDWINFAEHRDLHLSGNPHVEKHWDPATGQYTDKTFVRYSG